MMLRQSIHKSRTMQLIGRITRLFILGFVTLVLAVSLLLLTPTFRFSSSPEFVWGGLGLTKDAWEIRYDQGQSDIGSSAFYRVGPDSSALVAFTPFSTGMSGRVKMIEIHLPYVTMAEDEIQSLVASVLPPDAILLE